MCSINQTGGFVCFRNLYMYLNTTLSENRNLTNYVSFKKRVKLTSLQELLSLRKEYTQQDYTSCRAQILANYTQSVLSGNTTSYCVNKQHIVSVKIYIKLKMK